MNLAVHGAGFLLVSLLGWHTPAQSARVSSLPQFCPLITVADSLFPSNDGICLARGFESFITGAIIEGNELSLQKALNIIHKNEYDYVALLFYSSSCPFSALFKPIFSMLSSIFTSIPHIAIEESAVRPSILSKYGVHGFPSLILLNSTMRVRYQGSRTLDSIIAYYDEFTGIKASTDKTGSYMCNERDESFHETCPFPWAKSPENLLHQQTYLTLATIFVILRLVHFIFPTLRRYTEYISKTCTVYFSTRSFWERPSVYFNQVIHFVNSLKKSNLQEGAKNAQAWASKSLATVSLGDTGSSCDASLIQSR